LSSPGGDPGGSTGVIEQPPPTGRGTSLSPVVRVLGALAILVIGFIALGASFLFVKNAEGSRFVVVGIALVAGVGGVFFVFWSMNNVVQSLPARYQEGVRPFIFVGPALVILIVFLVYPVINTILVSFKDAVGQSFVGLDNYRFVFTDDSMLRAIRNTFGWIIIVPLFGVSIGLAFATLADRLRRGEAAAKAMIFLPMAISFAGASITWRLIYAYRPAAFGSNIGVLNGVMEALGQNPISWLDVKPWNNLFLMVIMVWMQTGFAMVVLSAAIKSIPDEILEAARIDGANELQVFRRIIVPSILPTIAVVTTYMVINAMKVFDIVFVMGSPENRGTEVIAERMIHWFFIGGNFGRGAAIAVILFVAVIPVMIINIRRFREEEAIR
jgi:alpha-glucoside transport system permease protein